MKDQPLSRRAFLTAGLASMAAPLAESLTTGAIHCPILMYHYLSDPPEDASATRRDLSVGPALFAAQLDALAQDGYSTVHLGALAAALSGGEPLPERPVVISFDDGYADLTYNALPLLQTYGFTATSFIVPGLIGGHGYLTWDGAASLRDAGIEIGSHSLTHPDLTTLNRSELDDEIEGASAAIEAALGSRPSVFCYPLGRFNSAVIRALRRAGITAAVSTQDGTLHRSSGLLTLRRVRVRNSTTVAGLRWLIERRV